MQTPEFIKRISEKTWSRALFTVAATLFMLQLYSLANRTFEPKVDFLLPIDELIPFLPWTVFVYQSLYIMVLVGAMTCPPRDFIRVMLALITNELIAFCFFAAFTAHYPRPDPMSLTSPFWQDVYLFLHGSDGPGNTFPSIHASMAYLIGWRMTVVSKNWLWLAWGICISFTTMTTKQHYILDVVAAIPLAITVNFLVFRSLDQERKALGSSA